MRVSAVPQVLCLDAVYLLPLLPGADRANKEIEIGKISWFSWFAHNA